MALHSSGVTFSGRTFLTLYASNSGGGAIRRYMELIRYLLAEGAQVVHVSPAGFSLVEHPRLSHVACGSEPVAGKLELARAVRASLTGNNGVPRPDTALCFGAIDGLIVAAARLGVRGPLELVVNLRGDNLLSATWLRRHVERRFWRAALAAVLVFTAEAIVVATANRILFVTTYDQRIFGRRHGWLARRLDARSAVITNNANPSWVARDAVNTPPTGAPHLIYVGAIYLDGKGIRQLLDAFGRLLECEPSARLTLIGDGPQFDEAKAHAAGVGPEVEFVGRKQDISPYYANCTAVVVPTESHEGSCNVALEGLGSGCVVVGSRLGGIAEILYHDHLLFEPGDSDSLYRCLSRVLEPAGNELARSLCREQRAKYSFDWGRRWAEAARLT
jgi:glycosyltransferase involved in cell wall biosynthesis